MGEGKRKLKEVVVAVKRAVDDVAHHAAPMSVVTPGGRIQVQWDTRANATAMGQLAFFAEFLEVAGLFDRWVTQCPLHYSSPNAPKVRDVLGTWLLSRKRRVSRLLRHSAGWAAAVIAPSLIFGYFRERHRQVCSAIILHAAYNACYLLMA